MFMWCAWIMSRAPCNYLSIVVFVSACVRVVFLGRAFSYPKFANFSTWFFLLFSTVRLMMKYGMTHKMHVN